MYKTFMVSQAKQSSMRISEVLQDKWSIHSPVSLILTLEDSAVKLLEDI